MTALLIGTIQNATSERSLLFRHHRDVSNFKWSRAVDEKLTFCN